MTNKKPFSIWRVSVTIAIILDGKNRHYEAYKLQYPETSIQFEERVQARLEELNK